MSCEKKDFQDLGFDLLGLGKIVYAAHDPDQGGDQCPGGQCSVSCTNGCSSCRPGNK